MDLKTIKSSISKIPRRDAIRIIIDIRQSRRIRKVKPGKKATPIKVKKGFIDELNIEQATYMLRELLKIKDKKRCF